MSQSKPLFFIMNPDHVYCIVLLPTENRRRQKPFKIRQTSVSIAWSLTFFYVSTFTHLFIQFLILHWVNHWLLNKYLWCTIIYLALLFPGSEKIVVSKTIWFSWIPSHFLCSSSTLSLNHETPSLLFSTFIISQSDKLPCSVNFSMLINISNVSVLHLSFLDSRVL